MASSDWHLERRTAVAVPPAWGPGRDIAPPTFTWPGQQSSPTAEPDTGPADEAAAGLGGERGGLLDAIASGWGQSAEERDRAEEGAADRRTGDRAGGRPFQGRSEDRAEAPIFVWPGERTARSSGDAAAAGGPSSAGAVRAGKGVSGRRKKRTRDGEGVTEGPLNEVGGRGGEGFSGGELSEPDAQDGGKGSERRRGEREDPHEPSGVVESTPGAEVPPKAKYDADGWHSEVLAGSSWFAEEQQASGKKRSSKERSGKGRRAGGRGAGGESGHSEEDAAGNGSSGGDGDAGGSGSSGGDAGGSGSSWADAKGSGSFRTVEGGSGSVGGGSEGSEQFGGSGGSGLFGGGGSEEGGLFGEGPGGSGLFAGGSGGSGRSGRRAKGSGRFGRGARGRGTLPDGPDAESSAAAGPEADPESVARAICLRLLTMAPKTRAQLAEALRKRDVPDEAAEKVLDRFAELGLINDEAFAEAWVDSRHHGRGLAKRALAAELRHRGVDTDTVKEAVDRLDSDQEAETARRLVERKLASTRSLDTQTRTRRLAGMLARKGYSSGVAYRVIREALEQEGIDLEDDFS
ncbi:recombination regulator RecX [Nonomuraea spiralis]|uniref:recombination regulator RecX n=1 Tax=Nonomuraea spiralis TaxID=46182 RepID=UPI0037B75EA7